MAHHYQICASMDEVDDSITDASFSDDFPDTLKAKPNIVDLNSWLKQLPTVQPAPSDREDILQPGCSKDMYHHNGGSAIPSTYSSLRSQKSGKGGDTLGSRGKRRVKIMLDIHADKDSSTFYSLHRDAVTGVPYNSLTWDSMVQNLRIALQMNSLFLCDKFLGEKKARNLYRELLKLRDSGFFDLHMRTSNQGAEYQYACACLTQPEVEYSHIDGLALIVYKLAMYYTKKWKGIKVNVLYFPNGMQSKRYQQDSDRDDERTLTCLYFCTELSGNEGSLAMRSTGHSDIRADHKFDRLVAFWETADDITTLNKITNEVFLINLVLKL